MNYGNGDDVGVGEEEVDFTASPRLVSYLVWAAPIFSASNLHLYRITTLHSSPLAILMIYLRSPFL